MVFCNTMGEEMRRTPLYVQHTPTHRKTLWEEDVTRSQGKQKMLSWLLFCVGWFGDSMSSWPSLKNTRGSGQFQARQHSDAGTFEPLSDIIGIPASGQAAVIDRWQIHEPELGT